MSTTERSVRAWVPATVTTLLGLVLVVGSGLVWEILQDQGVDELNDPDSVVGSFVYGALAPLGSLGIIGDAPASDWTIALLGGLVPFVVLVYLFTWVGARGSALATLLGAWLGTILGAGLGAVTAWEISARRDDLLDQVVGLQHLRVDRIDSGLYWGAAVGLVLGLVAVVVRAMSTRSRSLVDPDEPASPWPPPAEDQEPADTAVLAPPGGAAEDTVASTGAQPEVDAPVEQRAP